MLFSIYNCYEVFRIVNHSHMLFSIYYCYEVAILKVLNIFLTFAHKVTETWSVLPETWHTTLFGIYYCVELVRIVNHSHVLEITCEESMLRVF